jgi:hypothetical protein
MTFVVLPYRTQLAPDQPEDITMVLADIDAILQVVNGDIRNDNIHANAQIDVAKLLIGGTPDGTKFLGDDKTWKAPPGAAGGRFLGRTILTAVTGTFTTQASTTKIVVKLVGGGAAGGGSPQQTGSNISGGGGGSGGYSEKLFAVTGATGYTYGAGAGGAAASGAIGGNGGDTTFAVAGVTVTAKGGLGGQRGGFGEQIGGDGAPVGTNGDLNAGGMPGGFGDPPNGAIGGYGGCSIFGGGAPANLRTTGNQGAGVAAKAYGSGGSGGWSLSAVGLAVAGGAGSGGVIIVEEYS